MKRKILEVVGRMDRAGQETFLMNVLRAYDSEKYEIWFSVNTDHIGDYENEITQLGGKIWHNPYKISIKTLYHYLRAFRSFLRREGPFDVVHCHVYFFGGFIMKIARQENIPVRIMHSHNTSDGMRDTFFRNAYRGFCRRLIKNNATNLVSCGEEAYEALFQEKCPGKHVVLSNAIVMASFKLTEEDSINTRKSLGIEKNNTIIINVARFLPVKNHERIISIFDHYHKTFDPSSVLLLVGDGEGRKSVEKLVEEKGLSESVLFLGKREDIPQLLNATNILLMPSLFEGLPVSLIEAQAAGVSCVISDVITQEVDMKLGLVKFVSLDSSDDCWANEIYSFRSKERPSFEQRNDHLTEMGYTISATWDKLTKLYG